VAEALRYAGDQRLDVVNLSLFADPYLHYCANEAGQRAILEELKDAARYAQERGFGDPPPATKPRISVIPPSTPPGNAAGPGRGPDPLVGGFIVLPDNLACH
jgi:hypothetical protein